MNTSRHFQRGCFVVGVLLALASAPWSWGADPCAERAKLIDDRNTTKQDWEKDKLALAAAQKATPPPKPAGDEEALKNARSAWDNLHAAEKKRGAWDTSIPGMRLTAATAEKTQYAADVTNGINAANAANAAAQAAAKAKGLPDPTAEYNRLKAALPGKDAALDALRGTAAEANLDAEVKAMTAAINRYKTVVTQYQTTRHVEEALARLTEAYMAIGIVGEAQTAAAVLGLNFPDSRWYKDAYDLVKSGGVEPSENTGSYISKAFKKIGLG